MMSGAFSSRRAGVSPPSVVLLAFAAEGRGLRRTPQPVTVSHCQDAHDCRHLFSVPWRRAAKHLVEGAAGRVVKS